MDNIYIEYTFKVSPKKPGVEILIAELGALTFESFIETSNGLIAYIQKTFWNKDILSEVYLLNNNEFKIEYSHKEIKQTNWNAEWENNFTPINIDNLVSVRAPFHENPNLQYDIIIEPKMSFGTGHHETTHMMIQHLINLDLSNKKVLDMGCGTGILAIFSEMRGAKHIEAIDIDNWCYLNSIENIEKNKCKNINVYEGNASLLHNKNYDLIIANINRNILIQDLNIYSKCLSEKGILLLSGFYEEDIIKINSETNKYNLKLLSKINRNNWVALKYIKE